MKISKDNDGNKPNLQETLLELKKVFASPLLAESILNKTLLIELKHLQKFCPAGIYIIPQSDNIKIWHGIIFPREGIYRDGIFKYQIHIPTDYPNSPPKVIFVSKVYHPLINQKTGAITSGTNAWLNDAECVARPCSASIRSASACTFAAVTGSSISGEVSRTAFT